MEETYERFAELLQNYLKNLAEKVRCLSEMRNNLIVRNDGNTDFELYSNPGQHINLMDCSLSELQEANYTLHHYNK